MVLFLAAALISVCSCGRKDDSPEAIETEKAIKAQWAKIIAAIKDKDIEAFKSLCSGKIREDYSQERYEDYIKISKESMDRRAAADYEITTFKFNKDMTEATVTLKNNAKKKFIMEEGDWYLKSL